MGDRNLIYYGDLSKYQEVSLNGNSYVGINQGNNWNFGRVKGYYEDCLACESVDNSELVEMLTNEAAKKEAGESELSSFYF